MIIYEITTIVRVDLIESYEKYLRDALIPDLLATSFFSGAKFSRAGENRYRIQFEARDQETLDEYLKTAAASFRADFFANFPEGVELSRENWEVLQIWNNN